MMQKVALGTINKWLNICRLQRYFRRLTKKCIMAFGQPQLCLVANIVAKKGVTKKSFIFWEIGYLKSPSEAKILTF